MGFGPKAPDPKAAEQAIRDIVALLYPERATEKALEVLTKVARTLLRARAPLSFEAMDRFLKDPAWRASLLADDPRLVEEWADCQGRPIAPESLDADFAWLLADRLAAIHEDGNPAVSD